MVKITAETPSDRIVTIEANLDWLQCLYDASRQGRRSIIEQASLTQFGNQLAIAIPEIEQGERRDDSKESE